MYNCAVYIDRNFLDAKYPNKPTDGDSFYTHGFGSLYARKFKEFNLNIRVECWKCDPRIKKIVEKEISGVLHRVFPSYNFSVFGQYSPEIIKFFKKYAAERKGVVYNISSFDHMLFYSLALKMKAVPLAVQNHGESPAGYRITSRGILAKIYWKLMKQIETNCFKNTDLIYLLDKRLQQWLPKNCNKSIIVVNTTGVDENVFVPMDRHEAKLSLGLDPMKKHLLYVGKLDQIKRPDILIDVYNKLKLLHPDIELILAGNSKDDVFFEKAKTSGAIMRGTILQSELYKWLSAANVYVLPKLDQSIPFGGIGMLSVQALFCNTPIAGSTVAAFPEADRSQVGIATETNEELTFALLKLLYKNSNAQNLRELASKYYSWSHIAATTHKDYNLIAKKYSAN